MASRNDITPDGLFTPGNNSTTELPCPLKQRFRLRPLSGFLHQPRLRCRLFHTTDNATPHEINPGIGEVILTDDFSDDLSWDTAASDQASAAISNNRLSLAVQPNHIHCQPAPRHNLERFLCRDHQRVPAYAAEMITTDLSSAPPGHTFYRFVLDCNRMIYVERINSGVKLIIFDPVLSGDAPAGAPGEVRIGIWAVGREMRLFLNDRFQFSVIDKSFPSGALGVFARSAGDTSMSVTFSDLTVYDVNYIPPTRTPSP